MTNIHKEQSQKVSEARNSHGPRESIIFRFFKPPLSLFHLRHLLKITYPKITTFLNLKVHSPCLTLLYEEKSATLLESLVLFTSRTSFTILNILIIHTTNHQRANNTVSDRPRGLCILSPDSVKSESQLGVATPSTWEAEIG